MLSQAAKLALIMSMTTARRMNEVMFYASIEDFRKTTQEEDDEELYYPNQDETAEIVTSGILNNSDMIFQLVIARTQAGKTGCMIAIVEKCFECENPGKRINPKNIFVITGLSSNDWQDQTSNRMPFLKNNVYHRNQLKKMAKDLQGKKDVLIIIDEVHIACKKKMTIDKMMKELNYKDTEYLLENNINFVEFSATPKAILEHHREWQKKGNAKIHTMNAGHGYKGPSELLNGRAYQFEKLDYEDEDRETSMNAIRGIRTKISETYASPRFHIIRAPKGEAFGAVKERFIEVFGQEDFDYKDCTSESGSDINKIMKNGAPDGTKPCDFPPPSKHTFIFIKENIRCAVTIKPKKHVGILYERFSARVSEDVIVQGLAGRACGYDVPDDMIVYTNIQSLKDYEKDWEHHFESEKMRLSTRPTFVDPTGFDVDPLAQPAPVIAPKKNNVEIYPRLLESMVEVRAALNEVKGFMGLKNAPRPKEFYRIDGYAVSTKALGIKKAKLKASNRLTIQAANAIGKGSNISAAGKKGGSYLVLPVYESMDSHPDSEKYQLRYLKIN